MEQLFQLIGSFVGTHGAAILKLIGILVGLAWSLLKIKKWIVEADREKTLHVVKEILAEHCPVAHSELSESIGLVHRRVDDLQKTIIAHSPNGKLDEILNTMKQLSRDLS